MHNQSCLKHPVLAVAVEIESQGPLEQLFLSLGLDLNIPIQ